MNLRKIILSILSLTLSISSFAISKGDILTVNGVKGIVFSVDESGEHGIMMSVKALRMKKNMFCKKSSNLKGISQTSTADGQSNTAALVANATTIGNTIFNYPLIEWCVSLGKGWYIPSSKELKVFINYWLGNEEEVDWDEDETDTSNTESSKTHKQHVNEIMLNAGGIPFLNGVLTSTITSKGDVVTFQYDRKKDTWRFEEIRPMSADEFTVGRAFYKF